MDKLIEIISFYTDEEINDKFNLKELKLQELDFFDLLMDIEDEFDISIDEDEFNELITVKDLFIYIKEL